MIDGKKKGSISAFRLLPEKKGCLFQQFVWRKEIMEKKNEFWRIESYIRAVERDEVDEYHRKRKR